MNGIAVTDVGSWVDMVRDRIAVDGRTVRPAVRLYFALNKPRGLVTSTCDERGRGTVYNCLPHPADAALMPVGRLDKASEGLLLLTNDTRWAQRILDPHSHLPKVYHVRVDRHLASAQLERLQAGVTLPDGRVARARAVSLLRTGRRNCWLEVTLEQGINRQIRRMIATLDAQVLRLVRVAIGPISLGSLAKGESRPLTPGELDALCAALAPDQGARLEPKNRQPTASQSR